MGWNDDDDGDDDDNDVGDDDDDGVDDDDCDGDDGLMRRTRVQVTNMKKRKKIKR